MNDTAVQACRYVLEYDRAIRSCGNDPNKMDGFCTAKGETLDLLYWRMMQTAYKALQQEESR